MEMAAQRNETDRYQSFGAKLLWSHAFWNTKVKNGPARILTIVYGLLVFLGLPCLVIPMAEQCAYIQH